MPRFRSEAHRFFEMAGADYEPDPMDEFEMDHPGLELANREDAFQPIRLGFAPGNVMVAGSLLSGRVLPYSERGPRLRSVDVLNDEMDEMLEGPEVIDMMDDDEIRDTFPQLPDGY